MRLFTAFELPGEVKDEVVRLQHVLHALPFRRWQSEKTLHLTLHFLGEVDPALLPSLQAHLRETCRGFGAFRLELDRLGAFPTLRRPRTLWIGLAGQTDRLHALEAQVRPVVVAQGIALEERGYAPHITLARDPAGRTEIPEVQPRRLSWQVAELVLFQSSLERAGAVHTRLARFPLT